jgi:hypothetical protein
MVCHLSTAVCAVHVTEPALPFALTTSSVHTLFVVLAAASTAAVATAAVAVAMLVRVVTGSAVICCTS